MPVMRWGEWGWRGWRWRNNVDEGVRCLCGVGLFWVGDGTPLVFGFIIVSFL